ncbi:MAG: hypothetical protein ACPGVT_08170 [Maricaulaceae bacterium]
MMVDDDTLIKTLPTGWIVLPEDSKLNIRNELIRELCDTHCLHGQDLRPIARHQGRDDFLFARADDAPDCYVVHLTWSKETSPNFPWTTAFKSYSDFTQNVQKLFE